MYTVIFTLLCCCQTFFGYESLDTVGFFAIYIDVMIAEHVMTVTMTLLDDADDDDVVVVYSGSSENRDDCGSGGSGI